MSYPTTHRKRWPWLALIALVAVGAVVVTLVLTRDPKPARVATENRQPSATLPTPLPSDDHAAAVALLNFAADRSQNAEPTIRPDQFWKWETSFIDSEVHQSSSTLGITAVKTDTIITYRTPGNPYTVWRSYFSSVNRPPSSIASAMPQSPPEYSTTTCDDSRPNAEQAYSFKDFAEIPRDPDAYRHWLLKDSAGSDPNVDTMSLFFNIWSILSDPRAPADVRATLYRTAATLPTITITDRRAEVAGHTGVALSVRPPKPANESEEIVLDTSTGQLLGIRTLTLDEQTSKPLPQQQPEFIVSSRTVIDKVPEDLVKAAKPESCEQPAG